LCIGLRASGHKRIAKPLLLADLCIAGHWWALAVDMVQRLGLPMERSVWASTSFHGAWSSFRDPIGDEAPQRVSDAGDAALSVSAVSSARSPTMG
jgi:hypothetical protein